MHPSNLSKSHVSGWTIQRRKWKPITDNQPVEVIKCTDGYCYKKYFRIFGKLLIYRYLHICSLDIEEIKNKTIATAQGRFFAFQLVISNVHVCTNVRNSSVFKVLNCLPHEPPPPPQIPGMFFFLRNSPFFQLWLALPISIRSHKKQVHNRPWRYCPMGTMGGQNCYQSIPYDILSCRQVSFTLPLGTPSREEHEGFQRL